MKSAKRIKPIVVTATEAAKTAKAIDASRLLGLPTRQEFEAAVAAGAIEYSACRFMGRGVYDTRRSPTLEGARAHAADMGIDRVMIYAINRDGRSVLVEAAGKPVVG